MSSIKEQVYLEKMNQLKNQLHMLMAGTHLDYVRQLEILKLEHGNALEFNKLCRQLETERIERDCENEKTAALREFEEKTTELRESLITELEERRRQIEHEYQTMELTSDNVEVKPMKTRNLRRRCNDPAPVNDNKRTRKASPTQIQPLSAAEIAEDLKLISAATANMSPSAGSDGGSGSSRSSSRRDRSPDGYGGSTMDGMDDSHGSVTEAWIEDGKLFYQRNCYAKGQPVYIETSDAVRTPAVIQTIGLRDLTLRLNTNKKMQVTLSQLQQGKCVLWRRSV